MEYKPGQMNNLLEVFAETENRRANQVLKGLTEKDKIISIRCEIKKKVIDNIQYMFGWMGRPDVSETLKLLGVKTAEALVFNDQLKVMVEEMAVKMIRQGLIVLEVENSKFVPNTRQLTLTALMMNPQPTTKRLYIEKRAEE